MHDLHDDIAALIDNATPALDISRVVQRARRRRRRHRRIVASTFAAAALVAGVALLLRPQDPPTSRVSVKPGASTTTSVMAPTTAPLVYRDLSKPPPLRIELAGQTVDVTTQLGCWFSSPAGARLGHGFCADGVVDPARFLVTATGTTRFVVRSPVSGTITARMAPAPPPHGPHELARVPTTTRELAVQHRGTMQWFVDLPILHGPTAIYIDLKVVRSKLGVSGDAYYGFELRPA